MHFLRHFLFFLKNLNILPGNPAVEVVNYGAHAAVLQTATGKLRLKALPTCHLPGETLSESAIDRLFAAAVRLRPGPERSAFLNAAAGEDLSLLEAVEKLLELHDDAGSFLELNALERDPTLLQSIRNYRSSAERLSEALWFVDREIGGESLGRIGRFKLLQPIGLGGNSVVILAADEWLQREVAVKLLSPESDCSPIPSANLLKEARAAAAIADNHIVQIFDVGEHSGVPYLVMEYFPCGSLQSHLDRCGPLIEQNVRSILLQVAAALEVAHRSGILHRDLKPGNVLVDRFPDRVKLGDFGLAMLLDSPSALNTAAGTLQFCSPEQLAGEPLDARSDLFGLGCLGVALLTGHSPFAGWPTSRRRGLNAAELQNLLSPGRIVLSPKFEVLLLSLLETSQEKRPNDAVAVRKALESV